MLDLLLKVADLGNEFGNTFVARVELGCGGVGRDQLFTQERVFFATASDMLLELFHARPGGIKVARTTGSNAVPVAEFTLGLILSTLRHMAQGHAELQKGHWRGFAQRDAFMLSGKTVGIVGFGAIGKTVARLLTGFGCTILYTKPTPLPAEEEARLIRSGRLPLMRPTPITRWRSRSAISAS